MPSKTKKYRNDELYSLLQISPSATQDDIRKAYRKLALTLHPDKQNECDTERVCQAYSILNDPVKRNVYDRYGQQGLYVLDRTNGSTKATHILMNLHCLYPCFAAMALFTILSMVALFYASRKADGRVALPAWMRWSILSIPVSVSFGVLTLLIFGGFAIVYHSPMLKDCDPGYQTKIVSVFLGSGTVSLLMLAQTVILALRLDGIGLLAGRQWMVTFIPYFVAESIWILSKIINLRAALHSKYSHEAAGRSKKSDIETPSDSEDLVIFHPTHYIIIDSLLWTFTRLASVLLLLSSLDYVVPYPRWAFLIPIYCSSLLYAITTISAEIKVHRDLRKGAASGKPQEQIQEYNRCSRLYYTWIAIAYLCFLPSSILLNLRLVFGPQSVRTLWIVLPVYIGLGIATLIFGLAMPAVLSALIETAETTFTEGANETFRISNIDEIKSEIRKSDNGIKVGGKTREAPSNWKSQKACINSFMGLMAASRVRTICV